MSDVDLTGVSAEALTQELSARAAAAIAEASAAELEALAPYTAVGFGGSGIDDLIEALGAQRVNAIETMWSKYLEAALVGLRGMQGTVGARIQFLQAQGAVEPPVED